MGDKSGYVAAGKIGIVFSGGGGKGAYEIGAWKAIAEAGIKPDAVSGTSVGALNGALMLQGDLALAEKMWRNLEAKNVLSLDPASLPPSLVSRLTEASINLASLPLAIKRRGIFSQDGLLAMMDEALDEACVAASPIDFFACVHDPAANIVRYFKVNDHPKEMVRDILLASCALPWLFDEIEIEDSIYTDGGWFWGLPHKYLDNTPVGPVYDAGCTTIILVCLTRDDLIDRAAYPGARLLPIVPREHPGDVLDGTLDFSNAGAARRMEQGYQDAKRILDQIDRFISNEAAYAALWDEVAAAEEKLPKSFSGIEEAARRRVDIRQAIDQFNKAVISDRLTEDREVPIEPERDLLTEVNRNLLTQIERNSLRQRVDDYLAKNFDNAVDVVEAATEAVACLAPVESQAGHLREQGFFSRMWNSLTGKNLGLVAQNQTDLAQAQFAAITLLGHIQRKNLLTFEMTVALNNRVNWLFAETAALHGEINTAYVDVYRSLATVFFKLRREIMRDQTRISKLEDRVGQLEWTTHIQVQTFAGREYRHLPPAEQVICLVNDFFRITRGSWNVRELLSLKQAMLNLKLEEKCVAAGDVAIALQGKTAMAARLTEGLERGDGNSSLPMAFFTDSSEASKKDVLNLPVPAFHLAVEVLSVLVRSGYSLATGKVDAAKELYLARLDELERLAEEYSLSVVNKQELADVRSEVSRFRLTAPLIGAFSCGKSTLLNKYMGIDLLSTNLPPETAVASELHPVAPGEEKIILHYLDGSRREYPLSELSRLSSEAGNMLYQEVHVVSPALARRPDVVLVDMPGLGSSVIAHNKAIRNYIREGVSFIVCMDIQQPLTDSVMDFLREIGIYEMGFSVLMTKKETRQLSDLHRLREEAARTAAGLAGRDVPVGIVSARKSDMDDLSAAIDRIDADKEKLMAHRFQATIAGVEARVCQSLNFLLNKENVSAADLAKKKRELEAAIVEIGRMLEKEGETVLRECRTSLVDGVASDVRSVMAQNKAGLIAQAKSGKDVANRISGLVQNTFQMSVRIRSQRVFEESAARVSRYVARSAYSGIDGGAMTDVGGREIAEISIAGKAFAGTGAAVAGFILLGPIGALIAGALGWLISSRSQERELKEQMESAFSDIDAGVRTEAARVLTDMAKKFLVALADKVDEVRQDTSHNIGLMEEQLRQSDSETTERRAKIREDMARLGAGEPPAVLLKKQGAGKVKAIAGGK